ncbi:patatin [Catenovulum agarivorans DS-2]|uniref:Patatin n=1 Tax=Catenovulum agarivorans DS-2 TaxID=1328313 RepID=W7QA74_9ALTE|nr:patatin-like phospholipase RssA [Catenovulum agarivorans]EWH09694.1 patatin [Catenovulum agarivorans DS-2]
MQKKPAYKLGLALGSGAARGWALIGILRALDNLGVKPDVIAGCSIGSLVGAAYATHKLPELEEWAVSLDTWSVVRLLDWGMGRGGIVSGGRLYNRLEETIGKLKIEECLIEYAAVATELYTGREHVFTSGSILQAIRASCAIPGLLSPQYIDGHWMVDGAVVNPVPVSICRALGASHVIAVDLNCGRLTPAHDPSLDVRNNAPVEKDQNSDSANAYDQQPNKFQDLLGESKGFLEQWVKKISVGNNQSPGMVAVATSAIDIMQNHITRSRLMADPPEILLQPKVSHIGILEFNRAAEAIKIGEQAVAQIAHLLADYRRS